MENVMDVGLVAKPAYPTKSRNFYEKPSPSEPATADAALRLTGRASLMLTLLLSLGLWAVIWALASAALR
jgi:hypothetical protein